MRKNYFATVLGLSVLILAQVAFAHARSGMLSDELLQAKSHNGGGPFNPQAPVLVVTVPHFLG